MKIYKINPKNPDRKIINKAINKLASGGVVLYPTDTVYGLGANIFNKKAVNEVYKIKNRELTKPLSILISNIEAMPIIADLNENQKKCINNYLPGPYTFILKKKNTIPKYITSGKDTVGIRIPDNNIARALAELFPITTTSANLSDEKTLNNPKEILEQLNSSVDLVLDVGSLKSNIPSKIIDLTSSIPKFLKR